MRVEHNSEDVYEVGHSPSKTAKNVGIILFAYLDDWLIIAKSKSQAIIHIQKVLKKFKKGRFLINLKS